MLLFHVKIRQINTRTPLSLANNNFYFIIYLNIYGLKHFLFCTNTCNMT
jgi:hypothetical protein